jgi:hypothetical protein
MIQPICADSRADPRADAEVDVEVNGGEDGDDDGTRGVMYPCLVRQIIAP